MKNKLSIGVIGTGMIGERHIRNFKTDKRIEIRWLCDKIEKSYKEKMREYGIERGTTEYRDILSDKSVDAVVIGTPPHFHAKILCDSLKANKHVLVEKPVCINRREMNRILKEASRHKNLVVLDCSCRQSRLQPKFDYVKKIIDSGKLGEVYLIHHNIVQRQSRPGIETHPGAKWFLNKRCAGAGPLIDWAVYDLSFHLGILGDVPRLKHVHSLAINGLDQVNSGAPVFDVEEHGMAFMEFDTGLKYYYETAYNSHCDVPSETRIYGTKGGLRFSYLTWDSDNIEYFFVDKGGKGKARKKVLHVDMSRHIDNYLILARHFVDCILGRAKPAMPLSLATKHLDIIFRILNAAKES